MTLTTAEIPVAIPSSSKKKSKTHVPPLECLFIKEMHEVYDMEERWKEQLTQMEDTANTIELKSAFHEWAEQSKERLMRLEEIYGLMKAVHEKKRSKVMKAICRKVDKIAEKKKTTAIKDVSLIMSAQTGAHCAIALYGSLAEIAVILNRNDVAAVLKQTLDEYKATDQRLSAVASRHVNYDALNQG